VHESCIPVWYRVGPSRGHCATRRVSADPLRRSARQARETNFAGAWIRKESDGLQRFLMAHGLDAAAAQAKAESTYCQLWTPKADSSAVPHPTHPPMHRSHSSSLGAPALPALTLVLPGLSQGLEGVDGHVLGFAMRQARLTTTEG
jgi:hypothetical protein